MPRYYFHIRSHDDYIEDFEGVELAADTDAREEALDSARELLAERVRRGAIVDGDTFEVHDADGTKVFTLPFRDVFRLE